MTLRDLKHSARRIASHPGIAAIAILSMALGIGANTTIFSVIHASLLRPLPYPDADRRVIIFTTNLNSPNKKNRGVATTADFLDWRTHSETLEDWHMFSFSGAFTATGAGLPERITYQHVTAGLLDSLGLRPVLGQLFGPGSEAEHPVIISEGYWRRRFGGEADVLGRKLTVNGKVCTIIWLIVSSGLKLTIAGLIAGVAGALGATRLLEQMLFGVKPWDPLTFSAVTLFVLVVAMAACALPALRATRVDPLAALRRE
jgi:putative ABC transport system permease protein